jgi:hypothetical protein
MLTNFLLASKLKKPQQVYTAIQKKASRNVPFDNS